MKKIVAFLMCLIFILTFVGCGKKEEKKSDNGVDIEYYAKLGEMPELEYALGEDVEKVKAELSAVADGEESHDSVYSVTEGENNVLIDNGDICYYYKKAEPQSGIGYIVNYGMAYGFDVGTVTLEIKEALSDYDYTEDALTEENAFFMFDTQEGSIIKCSFDENTVIFVFKDSALCATAIYKTDKW